MKLAAIFSLCLLSPALAAEIAPVALNSMSRAPQTITGAKVMDQRGHVLGQVTRVQTDQDGRPMALAFTTNSREMVVIGAAAVSYDGDVVVAAGDQPQIAALAGTRIASE